jgi:hypothetical protein
MVGRSLSYSFGVSMPSALCRRCHLARFAEEVVPAVRAQVAAERGRPV